MSVHVLSLVWRGYPGGGSELLTMLALADWSDDAGRCWPSIASIAKKTRLSPDQCRRMVHRLIDAGFVTVTAGKSGGAMSRRYQIVVGALTPCMDATPCVGARGGADARGALASVQGDPLHSFASRTVNEPSTNRKPTRDVEKQHRSTSVDVVPDGFAEFWNAYGKKTGKSNSIKEWKKIKPDAELARLIISAASRYSSTREQQYRKDPERWLKGRLWEDDDPAGQVAASGGAPAFAAGAI